MSLMPDRHLSGNSVNWKNWEAKLTLSTCQKCFDKHGTIYSQAVNNIMLMHPNCKCELPFMRTKIVGALTKMGPIGVDAQLRYLNKLPDYYVSKTEARKSGWKNYLGNLDVVLPSKMIGGDIFKNADEKLPVATDRVWREADFEYTNGFRNHKRVLYSNDGLIFATFDHYHTFYEIVS